MLKWIVRSRLAAFEKQNSYDMSYAREILDADTGAFMKFAKLAGMSGYRKGVPPDPYWAAKMISTLSEDCGPCTQLAVTLGLRDGADGKQLAAVIADNRAAMTDDVRLVAAFSHASLAHDLAADELRDQIVARWGKKGLVSISFALVMGRVYPTLKYALGHGKSCQRVTVEGTAVVPHTIVATA